MVKLIDKYDILRSLKAVMDDKTKEVFFYNSCQLKYIYNILYIFDKNLFV